MVDEKINKTSSLGLTVSCCYNHQLNINEKILHVSRCNIEENTQHKMTIENNNIYHKYNRSNILN